MANLITALLKIDTFWQRIVRIFAIISGSILFLAVLIVTADVARRYLFNRPIAGAVEGLGILMPYIMFFAFAYTLLLDRHVRVTLVTHRLPSKAQIWVDIITCALGVLFTGVLIYYSWRLFAVSFSQNEPVGGPVFIPLWLGRFAMPAGLFVFSIEYLIRFLVNVGYLTDRIKMPEAVTSEVMAGTE